MASSSWTPSPSPRGQRRITRKELWEVDLSRGDEFFPSSSDCKDTQLRLMLLSVYSLRQTKNLLTHFEIESRTLDNEYGYLIYTCNYCAKRQIDCNRWHYNHDFKLFEAERNDKGDQRSVSQCWRHLRYRCPNLPLDVRSSLQLTKWDDLLCKRIASYQMQGSGGKRRATERTISPGHQPIPNQQPEPQSSLSTDSTLLQDPGEGQSSRDHLDEEPGTGLPNMDWTVEWDGEISDSALQEFDFDLSLFGQ
ncbi:ORF1/Tas/Bel1 [Equine foamy virus]|uniref:ORF1/Tas/Bel1 n=2 Tax=Equine foamy virus TaxID=109270 RepID=Q9J4C5_9RETR|nr:ORF1/Tas/Bel1 [Equine foamy virus]AAF64416.1 ORF1/Tas/Bel1 [equine foamy virus Equus caballus]BBD82011.1 Tas [Equine foamy virus]